MKEIDGSASVSRHLTVGGNGSVGGNLVVGHNVLVKGWLDAPNVKTPLKGLYGTEEALKEAYPRPMPGWYALVGDGLPAAVWRVEKGMDGMARWIATGETGGEPALWLDDLEGGLEGVQDATGALREDLTAEGKAREEMDDYLTEYVNNLRMGLERATEVNVSQSGSIDQLYEATAVLTVDSVKHESRLKALEGAWEKVESEEEAERMASDGEMEAGKIYYVIEN